MLVCDFIIYDDINGVDGTDVDIVLFKSWDSSTNQCPLYMRCGWFLFI